MSEIAVPALAGRPSQWSRPRAYARLAGAYFVAYVALNVVTNHRSVHHSAITLWTPDDALSVLLLMESWTFAPVFWAAQFAVNLLFQHFGPSAFGDSFATAVLTAGHTGLAWTLRRRFGLNIRAMRPRDLVVLMAVVPIGVAVVGLFYCLALLVTGGLARADFLTSYAAFWIGDAAAMGVIMPATGAMFRVMMTEPWRASKAGLSALASAATLAYVALVIVISASSVETRYLFNLLYLPILLIGMKFGYDAGALALLLVQLMLLAALTYFNVSDRDFAAYQVLMFILAITGQALGATFTEWEAATAELRLQQTELSKVSERATNGAIAAAMSHEVSQPLASIAAYVFAARRLIETKQGEDKALSALRKAEAAAGRAREIIERLRDFVAKGEVARERVDLEALVETVLRLHRDAARERDVMLARGPGVAGPWFARVDRVGVEQAIANLVLNAIEAVPPGRGEVAVALRRRGDRAAIAVEDNGPGVSPEIAARLFEPFETTKPRGMGLGLPLAKEIATRHGGALTWTPLGQGGTRFELELPVA